MREDLAMHSPFQLAKCDPVYTWSPMLGMAMTTYLSEKEIMHLTTFLTLIGR